MTGPRARRLRGRPIFRAVISRYNAYNRTSKPT